MKVAIFVFNDMQILDFAGPMDVFATNPKAFTPFTVGSDSAAVTTTGGLQIQPSYTFADAPPADILVIPGGNVNEELDKPEVIEWVRTSAEDASYVLTICTGAFLAAKAGILQDLTATTYHTSIYRLKTLDESIEVVTGQRFTDNGKIICSAGITSGIDAAFHLVQKILGMGEAQKIALDLEFDWRTDGEYARANLADLHLPDLQLPEQLAVRTLDTRGDSHHWTMMLDLSGNLNFESLGDHLKTTLREGTLEWVTFNDGEESLEGQWLKTRQNERWQGHLMLEQTASNQFQLTMRHGRIS